MSALTFFTTSRLDADANARLDAFVRSHPSGSPYHLSAWRNAVEQAYGYAGSALAAHGPDGDVLGLLPLCLVKSVVQGRSWVSLPYGDLGGPLAATEAVAGALVERARAGMAAAGVQRLDLRCTVARGAAAEPQAGSKVRMLLDLPDSAGQLMAGYPPKLRSQVRKAEKNGIVFETATHAGTVADFYAVYARNMHRLGSPAHSRAWFEAIHAQYAASGDLVIGLVRFEGTVIGAGLVLRAGPRAAIPWASTVAEFNHLAPNMLLYWGLQAHLIGLGVRTFDFGRSSMGEGTYRFKKQWGAEACALDWQDWTGAGRLPAKPVQPGQAPSRLRPLVEAAWQRLPLAMASAIGPRLRKYITL